MCPKATHIYNARIKEKSVKKNSTRQKKLLLFVIFIANYSSPIHRRKHKLGRGEMNTCLWFTLLLKFRVEGNISRKCDRISKSSQTISRWAALQLSSLPMNISNRVKVQYYFNDPPPPFFSADIICGQPLTCRCTIFMCFPTSWKYQQNKLFWLESHFQKTNVQILNFFQNVMCDLEKPLYLTHL